MEYAVHSDDRPDGQLFEVGVFTQRLRSLAGDSCDVASDEVLYVLSGSGRIEIGGESYELRPGVAVFVAAGTPWSASGDARAISVLVHEPEPSAGHAVIDLEAVEKGTATGGRQFVLGATPDCGCASVTQFVGLVPPGRAPDHFHRYDEVIYVLDGEGVLEIGGEQAPIRPGTCIHLPRTLVHCLANTGETELRLLGVFRPAGSPAEAYYPDGTLAVVPGSED
ncbi:MAG TPA: cupin domain-containing protein [Gaiellaceae bacterium]|jgi:mannose-6-phosphate isomerase-like protein (cupin superfamily)|nr:cupin domain-containing protein [Gaiellaceae bacterium]